MEDALFIPACPTNCAEPFNDMIHKKTIFDPNPEKSGSNVSDADFDFIRSETEPTRTVQVTFQLPGVQVSCTHTDYCIPRP